MLHRYFGNKTLINLREQLQSKYHWWRQVGTSMTMMANSLYIMPTSLSRLARKVCVLWVWAVLNNCVRLAPTRSQLCDNQQWGICTTLTQKSEVHNSPWLVISLSWGKLVHMSQEMWKTEQRAIVIWFYWWWRSGIHFLSNHCVCFPINNGKPGEEFPKTMANYHFRKL